MTTTESKPVKTVLTVKDRFKLVLIKLAVISPLAYVIADRIAHMFGICIGH